MDERVLRRLEFDLVREHLARLTESPIGRELAEGLTPATEIEVVRRRLSETAEARELLRLEPGFAAGGWHDIRAALRRALQGGLLEAAELYQVGENLVAIRRVKAFFQERGAKYPVLGRLCGTLPLFPELEEQLKKALRPPGEVADGASARLAEIRRRIERLRVEIKEVLENFVRSPEWQKYLQEPIITIREGRYVLPVRIEHRDKVKGLIHDQSASGATLFIEPLAVVEKGNEVRRLKAAEQREIERILTELTRAVGAVAGELLTATETLGRLDFILAKGRYSVSLDAVTPVLLPVPEINLRRARHPLLGTKAVPIDVRLGRDFDILIITGPNTGGKTVALKTVGLCVLMAQAGLEIPAAEGTEIGLFAKVFADIGDEQSITASLSTFSSHIHNLAAILREADERSLVLLDELGAGTDPREGAALACAILEELARRNVRTIATTHSSELKEFAAGRPRVENASVDFDPETLSPTYRLVIGQPGRSNAFEIAAGLGLPARLIARAKEFLDPEERRVRELTQELERVRRSAERDAAAAARLKEEALALKAAYEEKARELAARKEKLLAEAREQATALVRAARREAEEIVRELKEKLREEERREQEKAVQAARERLRRLAARHEEAVPELPEEAAPGVLAVGAAVYIPRFGQEGTVVGVSPQGVTVQVGSFRVELPPGAVRPVARRQPAGGVRLTSAAVAASPTIDLRGQRVEEALINLERHLDAALLSGLGRVDIIHGYGTGALRAAVREYLSHHPRVRSFRPGGPGEGGPGVTVAELA